jgi:hypothetical protein
MRSHITLAGDARLNRARSLARSLVPTIRQFLLRICGDARRFIPALEQTRLLSPRISLQALASHCIAKLP